MKYPSLLFTFLLLLLAPLALVILSAGPAAADPAASGTGRLLDPAGKTVGTRVRTPEQFERVPVRAGSFAEFLRRQPLKPPGALVQYFDGREKAGEGVYCAVVDRPLRPGDLEQCADAIIRLRAEYLFANRRYGEISFNFLSDGKPRRYLDFAGRDRSYQTFLKYLDFIFARANTTSLYDQLKPVADPSAIGIGGVFIQRDKAVNHAVIVVDLAVNEKTGEKIFLLAQSYMPAQETQILVNPNDESVSPWYSARFGEILDTPEWRFFPAKDLRKF